MCRKRWIGKTNTAHGKNGCCRQTNKFDSLSSLSCVFSYISPPNGLVNAPKSVPLTVQLVPERWRNLLLLLDIRFGSYKTLIPSICLCILAFPNNPTKRLNSFYTRRQRTEATCKSIRAQLKAARAAASKNTPRQKVP